MAVSSYSKIFAPFECRSDPEFSGSSRNQKPGPSRPSFAKLGLSPAASSHGLSSLIFRFPPNFVRQLSIKARRNCCNIGVAQIVAASWANPEPSVNPAAAPAAIAVDAAATGVTAAESVVAPIEIGDDVAVAENGGSKVEGLKETSFLTSYGSLTVHAGIQC